MFQNISPSPTSTLFPYTTLFRSQGRGADIPLEGWDDGIKSEKGGMKYIRFLIRRGANGEAYPAGGPRGRIRHVFSRRRGHRLAVRPRPAQPVVSPGHHPLGLYDIHAGRRDLRRRTRRPRTEHPFLVLAADPGGRCPARIDGATIGLVAAPARRDRDDPRHGPPGHR